MSAESFIVQGNANLSGEITAQGAKNEALQVISACLLTAEPVVLENVPDILDVRKLITLIKGLGVRIDRIDANTYRFQADNIDLEYFASDAFQQDAQRIRGSVLLIGPLLARFGKAYLPKPGGDKIGRRRLDTHFHGFQQLGASFIYDEKNYTFSLQAKKLTGAYVLMDEISVTGTGNMIMAATLATGTTTIYNAACEPYVQQLCQMLIQMGAVIEGVGSNLLRITGVSQLGGATHRILPDMIEIGSFIGLAAMTQSAITIKKAGIDHLGIIPSTFEKLGIQLEFRGDDIFVPAMDELIIQPFIDGSILTIYDAPWPGFTPDLMSIILVVATQAKGSLLVHQKMFESRLFFVDQLIDMGAQVILCDPHRATVIGLNRKQPLRGIEMTSPDIRAGVSLLIAALSAEGESIIHNIQQIDRGYENIEGRLKALGAQIERTIFDK